MAIVKINLPNRSTRDIRGLEGGDVSELLPASFRIDFFNQETKESILQIFDGNFVYTNPDTVNNSQITGFNIFVDGVLAWSFDDIFLSVRQYKQLFSSVDSRFATDLFFAGPDQIFGSNGEDEIFTFSGDDVVDGAGGNDFIDAGLGNDALNGGQGNDVMFGREGSDQLLGEDGDDFMNGNQDNDVIFGGSGNDLLVGGIGNDFINGNTDDDTLSGGLGDDALYGGRGFDSISGESGNDLIVGGEGNDLINGNIDNDTLSGGLGGDDVRGGRGNDLLDGQSGNDFITGGVDADLLTGGPGDDTFFTRPGASPLPTASTINVGTSGSDSTARFEFDNGVDIITDFDTVVTKDRINYSDGVQPNPFDPVRSPFFETLVPGTAYIISGRWNPASGGAFNAGDFIYDGGAGDDYLFFVAAQEVRLDESFPDGATSAAFIGNQAIVLLNPNLPDVFTPISIIGPDVFTPISIIGPDVFTPISIIG
jgi:Ca2+-binding RTX toxin-like protein